MKRRGRREEEEGRGGEMGRERGEKKERRRDREREGGRGLSLYILMGATDTWL